MHKWLISSRTMLINTSQQRNANQNHETPREGRKHVHTKTRTPVFTALLITARKWKQPSAHQGLYICCNHTMNIAWRWKGLKRWYTLQRERNAKTLHSSRGQKQQPTCSRIPFLWNVRPGKPTEIESRWEVLRMRGRGGRGVTANRSGISLQEWEKYSGVRCVVTDAQLCECTKN